ncbi:MAG: DUF1761 domain-containing protein [Candidatus Taylorbacteria bacterium]
MNPINIWSILVSVLVSFGIGALWYSPLLFGKEWMTLIGMSEKDLAETRMSRVWGSYVIQIVVSIISICILSFAISAIGTWSFSDGAFIGFFAWLGFVVPVGISELLWRKIPGKLFLIDTVYYLLAFTISGAIIAAWY